MPLITWTDSLSVNVKEIDEQHKKLVEMLNELNDSMREGKGKEVLGETISSMISYASTHFKMEEDYFDRFKYPDAKSHKMEHAAFVQRISAFKNQFDSGAVGLSTEVMVFLSGWLKEHIKGTDKKYTEFFNRNGLK